MKGLDDLILKPGAIIAVNVQTLESQRPPDTADSARNIHPTLRLDPRSRSERCSLFARWSGHVVAKLTSPTGRMEALLTAWGLVSGPHWRQILGMTQLRRCVAS
jgi:hypothetical protein